MPAYLRTSLFPKPGKLFTSTNVNALNGLIAKSQSIPAETIITVRNKNFFIFFSNLPDEAKCAGASPTYASALADDLAVGRAEYYNGGYAIVAGW
jgi:hypothetical protein